MAHPIGRWLSQLRRDLRFATVERAAPFAPRAPHGRDAAAFPTRRLVVREVVRETSDAVTLWLEDRSKTPRAELAFEAGQFFTLMVPVGGEILRRAYSASSSPRDPSKVGLTVKRVAGGRASTHLVETARAGDAFEVLGPSGSFTRVAGVTAPLVLVGGGSGITPLLSILREVLETEPGRPIALVYANRTPHDVIFARALEALAEAHPRLVVRSLFGATLDAASFAAELSAIAFAGDAELYVCGPEAMMRVVRDVLAARGTRPERIHEERFVSPQARASRPARSGRAVRVTVRLAGKDHDVLVPPGRTLLEAGLAADVPMPFSCALGGCGACRVKVRAGKIDMDEPTCLTDDERAKGYALACVGTPSDGAIVEAT
jgi:ring-1,2-phenylacetyl-CoA epoxidase subunit PaaE